MTCQPTEGAPRASAVIDEIIARAFEQYLEQVLAEPPEDGVRALLEVTFYAGFQAGAGNAEAGMARLHAGADAATREALKRAGPILGGMTFGDDDGVYPDEPSVFRPAD